MKNTDLQQKVDGALDAAVFENGYAGLMQDDPLNVAVDLCTYCPALETTDVEQVKVCVVDYQAWYEKHGAAGPRTEAT